MGQDKKRDAAQSGIGKGSLSYVYQNLHMAAARRRRLTEVYLNEMRRDFPAGELKPLSMILTSEAEGTAHTWGVFDGDTLAAYL